MRMLSDSLTPFDRWMLKCNLEYAKSEGTETVATRLEAGGYLRVAAAVRACRTIRENVRAFLMVATPAELERERAISLGRGDTFRASCVQELIDGE